MKGCGYIFQAGVIVNHSRNFIHKSKKGCLRNRGKPNLIDDVQAVAGS